MKDTFIMSVRQAAELDHAFERNGWTPSHIKALSSGDMLARILPVVLGHAEIKPREHLIDCDAPVFCPDDWEVLPPVEQIPSRVTGQLVWNLKAVRLYLSPNQKGVKHIVGNDLRLELVENKSQVYTAHVLDYLLKPENQHLIPEEWKGKAVFFWGTIYQHPYGSRYILFLYWFGSKWHWSYYWLGHDWIVSDPSAVLASSQSLAT